MKVLLISPLPPPKGGIATWTKVFTNYLNSRGIVHNIINTATVGLRIDGRYSLFNEIKRNRYISKQIISNKNNYYSIIHINSSGSTLGMIRELIILLLFRKVPTRIVEFHCDLSLKNGMIINLLLRLHYKFASKIMVLNTASRIKLEQLHIKNVFQIPNFIDLRSSNGCDEKHINESLKKILYVGHIIKNKGINELIEAAKILPEYVFHLAGRVSRDYLNRTVPSNVFLHGELDGDQLSNLYAECDLFVFPSYTEGFPMSILEAMSYGLPIIATDVGAIPDILSGTNNVLCKTKSVSAIVESIQLMTNTEARLIASQQNHHKVRETYSIDVVGKVIVDEFYQ